ncbi:MAG TPA: MOSC domain-containing protein [Azonexus sp.]|nr:MOSC domain-containing protein [Azonexus sp.]
MKTPIVERLFISRQPGGTQQECERIQVECEHGIVGDRHFGRNDWPGQNLTLVEAEEIERFCAEFGRPTDLAMTRRNLVTRGVRLNTLVGRTFTIGSVTLRGIETCEPCSSLGRALADAALPVAAVVRRWTGCGGLRATVIHGGEIAAGDTLVVAT